VNKDAKKDKKTSRKRRSMYKRRRKRRQQVGEKGGVGIREGEENTND
jgi:hypothetical protein